MKRLLILAAAAAMAAAPLAASAQGQYQYRETQRDYRGNTYRGAQGHGYAAPRYYSGQRLPSQYRNQNYRFNDYARYGYRAPQRGYSYYRTDSGDVVLAAIATGVITSVIIDALRDRNDPRTNGSTYRYVDPPIQRFDQYGRPY